MIAVLTDEDLNGHITRGVVRRLPELDLVRMQDAGLRGEEDPKILEWAARECRVLVTHNGSTMVGHAYGRVAAGHPMPGVIVVRHTMPIGQAIEEMLIVLQCSREDDLENNVLYLPI